MASENFCALFEVIVVVRFDIFNEFFKSGFLKITRRINISKLIHLQAVKRRLKGKIVLPLVPSLSNPARLWINLQRNGVLPANGGAVFFGSKKT